MNRSSWIWAGLIVGIAVALGGFFVVLPTVSTVEQQSDPGTIEAVPSLSTTPENPYPDRKFGRGEPRFGTPHVTPDALLSRSRALRLNQKAEPATGPFDATDAGLAVATQARTDDLHSCYRTARYHDPALPQELTLSVTIAETPDGLAATAVSTGLGDDVDATILEGCLATVFAELSFEGQPGTLTQAVTLSAD